MKHNWKTRIACGAALTLLAGVLTIPAMASASSQPAALKQQAVTVTLNGMTMELRDAQGNLVQPIVINGTAYLPVTYLGETLGWTPSGTRRARLSPSPPGPAPRRTAPPISERPKPRRSRSPTPD